MIKSRPLYQPLRIDVTGRRHLIVSEAAPVDEIWPDSESWGVERRAPGIPSPAAASRRAFRSAAELLLCLADRLPREAVGLRLYAVGTEAFLWDVHTLAAAHGLGDDEVFLVQAGSLQRRVYCVHCKTMIEDVTVSIVPCPGCAAHLFVRDHFSRRLAAFMGVMVDAEVPSEVPSPEMIYP